MGYESDAIWVVGPVRSGTNWVCGLLNPMVEKSICDDENFRDLNSRHILSSYGSFSFKINEDWCHLDKLLEMYPKSKFILVNRDGREVANSIAYPNRNSIPFRDFKISNHINNPTFNPLNLKGDRGLLSIATSIWLGYIRSYDEIINKFEDRAYYLDYNKLVGDFDIEYQKLCDFIGLKIDKDKFNKIRKPLKTPNQKVWEFWSKEQKDDFRNASHTSNHLNGGEALIKYGYEKNNNW